jgi:hypothetical protein
VLSAIALAGCGGADTATEAGAPPSAPDFRAQVDALCGQGQQRLIEAVDFSIPTTGDQDIILLAALAETQAELTPDFEALTPPADLATDYDLYLALRGKRLAAAEKAGETGRNAPAVGVLGEKMRTVAEDMDLMDCASRIDPAEKEIVSRIVVDDLMSPDPDACGTDYTPEYLKLFWPDADDPEEGCREERAKAKPADKVTVTEVTGQGPLATVSARVEGGPDGDATATLALVKVDGRWLIRDESFYVDD